MRYCPICDGTNSHSFTCPKSGDDKPGIFSITQDNDDRNIDKDLVAQNNFLDADIVVPIDSLGAHLSNLRARYARRRG